MQAQPVINPKGNSFVIFYIVQPAAAWSPPLPNPSYTFQPPPPSQQPPLPPPPVTNATRATYKLCSTFYLLHYSFMLKDSTHYPFSCTHYAQLCSSIKSANFKNVLENTCTSYKNSVY